jgi:hypothetical protein
VRRYLDEKVVYQEQCLMRIKLTNTDNCKTLMDEHGALANVTSGPVGTTVALSLGESNKSRPVSGGFWEAMDGKYATHFCL